jgi:hypothetical protein
LAPLSSLDGSTHFSPPRASYTAPLPTSHYQFNVRVPGTPTHQTRLQPPAELLTPPPSNQKAQTWTAPGAAFTERIRSSQNGGSDRSSLPSPTGSPVNEPRTAASAGGVGAPFGFRASSLLPASFLPSFLCPRLETIRARADRTSSLLSLDRSFSNRIFVQPPNL